MENITDEMSIEAEQPTESGEEYHGIFRSAEIKQEFLDMCRRIAISTVAVFWLINNHMDLVYAVIPQDMLETGVRYIVIIVRDCIFQGLAMLLFGVVYLFGAGIIELIKKRWGDKL